MLQNIYKYKQPYLHCYKIYWPHRNKATTLRWPRRARFRCSNKIGIFHVIYGLRINCRVRVYLLLIQQAILSFVGKMLLHSWILFA